MVLSYSIIDDYLLSLCLLALLIILWLVNKSKVKNAAKVLSRSKHELRESIQLSLDNPYPLVQVNSTGEIIFINPAAIEEFPDMLDKQSEHEGLLQIQITLEREIEINGRIYHQTITPIKVNNEQAFTVYFHDITERVRAEHTLQGMYEKAESSRQSAVKAKEARGEFLANMSHELRTPMNGILGLSDILLEGCNNEEQKELLGAIHSSSRNLLSLLNDILDFSKIEAGELSLEELPFGIQDLTRQLRNLHMPTANKKGIGLVMTIEPNVPEVMVGDPSRLLQILNNLIGNAIKFTAQGQVFLKIDGKKASDVPEKKFTLKLEINDTGIGIPKSKQKQIFEKFQQADASTSRHYGGTGLGLSITKQLIEAMDGTINLQSTEGQGTTFTVILPFKIASEKEQQIVKINKSIEKNYLNQTARILIVDDHDVNLMFLRKALKSAGIQHLDEAESGKQALSLYEPNKYDLILLDCQMPDIDGFSVAQKIRDIEKSHHASTPIIAVTADAMKDTEAKCKDVGMDGYITKPIEKDRLISILQNWIAKDSNIQKNNKILKFKKRAIGKKVFNWDRLFEFSNGDPTSEKNILNVYWQNMDNDLKLLKQSYKDKDDHLWKSNVHKIYGASINIGAELIAETCDAVHDLENSDWKKIDKIHSDILCQSIELHKVILTYIKTSKKEVSEGV